VTIVADRLANILTGYTQPSVGLLTTCLGVQAVLADVKTEDAL